MLKPASSNLNSYSPEASSGKATIPSSVVTAVTEATPLSAVTSTPANGSPSSPATRTIAAGGCIPAGGSGGPGRGGGWSGSLPPIRQTRATLSPDVAANMASSPEAVVLTTRPTGPARGTGSSASLCRHVRPVPSRELVIR